ncbi:type II toxin-antitoxin system RelE family toxin [SAR92 clade bacterium H246]
MAKYKVTFKKSVAKDLRNNANRDVQRILAQIDLLADNPISEVSSNTECVLGSIE